MNQQSTFHRHVHRLLFALFVAILGVGLLSSGAALAHNSPVGSSPAGGVTLATPPTTWSMTFAKSVPIATASGQLVRENGVRTDLPAPSHGVTDNVIVFNLPADISGRITARWRLVGTDGHVISGRVTFAIDGQSPTTSMNTPSSPSSTSQIPTAQTPPQPSAITPTTQVLTQTDEIENDGTAVSNLVRTLLRFATYITLTIIGGLIFSEWYIAQGTLFTVRGRQLMNAGTIGLLLLPIFSMWVLVDDLRGTTGAMWDGISTALSIELGLMTLLRIAIGALFAKQARSLLKRRHTEDNNKWPLLLSLILYCIALTYGGHSRSQRLPQIGIPIDVVHILAITAWLGGLIIVLAVVMPSVKSNEALSAFLRFGYLAERTVPLIIVTGIVQTFRLHPSVGSIFTSEHGQLLLAKICVVLVMLYLGHRNRLILSNRRNQIGVRGEIAKATLVRHSIYEVLLGAGAIGITSILVAVTPA